jgi:hypothetical protein
MEALEQKLQSILTEYDELQRKYTSLSIAYETLANEKGSRESANGGSYMSMLSNGWDFTDPRFSLANGKDRKKEEERSGRLSGYFRNR